MTAEYLARNGVGVKTTTYFKLMYPIYTGVKEYGIVRIAVFGMN